MAEPLGPSLLATLTPIDRDLLALVCAHRVVTSGQLERLFPAVAPRTLRYRVARLVGAGLLGRTRPYRDQGSAPSHLWPTRAADAYVHGEAAPRGGPRDEPNPFFLAHAAGITELFVGLATGAAPGLRLERFIREADAREPFEAAGRPRAIAPDARIELRDPAGRLLLAHVEIDRGTMSIPRLRAKAAGYAAYWFAGPWSKTYPFCPALLILTTTEARARSVLTAFGDAARRAGRDFYRADPSFTVSACGMVEDPGRALAEASWYRLAGNARCTVAECLSAARAPLDRALAAAAAERAARAERLATLRGDPERFAAHLRALDQGRVRARLAAFGAPGGQALSSLLLKDEPLSVDGRWALAAVVDYLGDDALELDGDSRATPTAEQQAPLDRLADHDRAGQMDRLDRLMAEHGSLPSLLAARGRLIGGALLSPNEVQLLPARALRDAAVQQAHRYRRIDYLAERDRLARAETGIAGRLFGRTDRAAARLDLVLLRLCRDCGETAFPLRDRAAGQLQPAQRCQSCGGAALGALDEASSATE
jgi:hypothetical protein